MFFFGSQWARKIEDFFPTKDDTDVPTTFSARKNIPPPSPLLPVAIDSPPNRVWIFFSGSNMATSGGYPNEADDYETESDDAPLDLGDGPDAAEKAHFLEVCFLVFGDQGRFFWLGLGMGVGKVGGFSKEMAPYRFLTVLEESVCKFRCCFSKL